MSRIISLGGGRYTKHRRTWRCLDHPSPSACLCWLQVLGTTSCSGCQNTAMLGGMCGSACLVFAYCRQHLESYFHHTKSSSQQSQQLEFTAGSQHRLNQTHLPWEQMLRRACAALWLADKTEQLREVNTKEVYTSSLPTEIYHLFVHGKHERRITLP